MNVENILKVADAIEKHELEWLGFNMATYYDADAEHACGTTACIAGWALALKAKEDGKDADKIADILFQAELDLKQRNYGMGNEDPYRGTIPFLAAEYLGLTDTAGNPDKHSRLFLGVPYRLMRDEVAADTAVKVLRHLAATGGVDWNVGTELEGEIVERYPIKVAGTEQ